MENKVKQLLGDELEAGIKEISPLDIDSEKKSKAIDDLTKLHKMRIEEIKAETERERALKEHELEQAKLKSDRKAQIVSTIVNVVLQGGLTLGSLIAYDIWHRRGLRFEETGTITSPLTRNLMSSMLPKMRK